MCVFMLAILVGCVCDDCCDDCMINDDRAVSSLKKAYTICVGVENGFAGKCPGAKRDVSSMKSMLAKYSKKIVTLTDKKATKAAVAEQLRTGVNNYELTIFFSSGHGGSQTAYSDKTEADGKDEFLCLYDTAMFDNEIWSIISQCKGRVMLIFDCCHSETIFRSPFSFSKIQKRLQATHNASGNINMLCWSGCSDDSYAYGSSSGGIFTKTIKRLYKKKLSYDELWKKVEADRTLMRQEKVQRTIIGSGFGSKAVFQ